MLVVSDILDAYLPLPEDLLGTYACMHVHTYALHIIVRAQLYDYMTNNGTTISNTLLLVVSSLSCLRFVQLLVFISCTLSASCPRPLLSIYLLYHAPPRISFARLTLSPTHPPIFLNTHLYFLITSKSVGVPRVYWHFIGCPPLHVQCVQSTGRCVRSFKLHTFYFNLSSPFLALHEVCSEVVVFFVWWERRVTYSSIVHFRATPIWLNTLSLTNTSTLTTHTHTCIYICLCIFHLAW